MQCPKCGSERKVKSGFMKGIQRYKCKECGCQYTRSTPRGAPLKTRLMAVYLYTHGLSMNAIAKLLGVSTPGVLRWIKKFAKDHCEMPTPGTSVIVELDEMWHYIQKNGKKSGSGRPWIMILDSLSTGNAAPVIAIH